MTTPYTLTSLYKENSSLLNRIKLLYTSIPQKDLLATPEDKSWSINQVVCHLNATLEYYLSQYEGLPYGEQQAAESDKIKMRWWVSWSVRSMLPNRNGKRKMKMRTFDRFNPSKEEAQNLLETKNRFVLLQNAFLETIEKAKSMDFNGQKVQSAAGKRLKFRIGESMAFVTAHSLRHLQQIEELKPH